MPANYVLLERVTLTASAASIVIDNIPQTGYTDLVMKSSVRSNNVGGYDSIYLKFNGVTTGYTNNLFYGSGSGSGATSNLLNSGSYGGISNGASSTADTFSNVEMYVPNYTSSDYKSFAIEDAQEDNTVVAYIDVTAGLWSNTAAINSITLTSGNGSFVAGSSFSLYGVAALGTTPVLAPKASGGDIVVSDGTYWYHAFLTSSVFTPNQNLSCDYLVIAGGGAGGYDAGGGGGAGGYLTSTGLSVLSLTNYAVTVGAGGAFTSNRGSSGSNSIFSSITATGGGGGGSRVSTFGAGADGGSGGGGGGDNLGAGGSASPAGQGNAGGRGAGGSTPGGGGGGAGAAGTNTTSETAPGIGGAGLNTLSSWASATGTGVSGYYAGGGGGGYNGSGNGGAGGGGAGGRGPSVGSAGAVAGTANTGSGGGGGSNSSYTITGNNGGSGIVIVRYTVA